MLRRPAPDPPRAAAENTPRPFGICKRLKGWAVRRRPAKPAVPRRPPAAPRRPRSRRHLGAAAGVGEDLEQHRVLHAAVDDVGAGHAALQRLSLLYTSDAADDLLCVDLGGRRIIKK